MTEASWLADPTGRHELRYWDGTAWTDHVSDQGVTALDPVGSAPPSVAPPAYPPTEPVPTAAPPTEPVPTFGPPPGAAPGFPAGPPPHDPTGGAGYAAGPSYSSSPADYATAAAGPTGKGAPVGLIVAVVALVVALAAGGWFLFLRDDGDEAADTDGQTTEDGGTDDGTDDTTTTTTGGTTTTAGGPTTTTDGPTTPTDGSGNFFGTFSARGQLVAEGQVYRETVTLDADQAIRVRAVDGNGADLVLSILATPDTAAGWYRAASEAAPDLYYAEETTTDEEIVEFWLPVPPSTLGDQLEADEVVLQVQDAEIESAEALFFVASVPGTYTIGLSEYSGLAADEVEFVIETKEGVDFASAYLEGSDPFLSGPFYDAGPGGTTPGPGPNPPSGPPLTGDMGEFLVDQFVQGGMSETQARCIVDALAEEFGGSIGGSTGALTPEQTEALTQITIDCLTGG